MRREDVDVCIARIGGTNRDFDVARVLSSLGVKASVVHTNTLARERPLDSYDALILPGGFAYGDYIRAGVMWARKLTTKVGRDLEEFIGLGKPMLGICNGFQVLVEAGYLPAFTRKSRRPEAALATNASSKFECRWVQLRNENNGTCIFTKKMGRGTMIEAPVAHGEGRFIFHKKSEKKDLARLLQNDQLVFRYALPDGQPATGRYPENPNGSFYDIAGICNEEGNVLGLMPHLEDGSFSWQLPESTIFGVTRQSGRAIFESMVDFLVKRF